MGEGKQDSRPQINLQTRTGDCLFEACLGIVVRFPRVPEFGQGEKVQDCHAEGYVIGPPTWQIDAMPHP